MPERGDLAAARATVAGKRAAANAQHGLRPRERKAPFAGPLGPADENRMGNAARFEPSRGHSPSPVSTSQVAKLPGVRGAALAVQANPYFCNRLSWLSRAKKWALSISTTNRTV